MVDIKLLPLTKNLNKFISLYLNKNMNLDYIRQDYHSVKPLSKNTLKVIPPTKSVSSCKIIELIINHLLNLSMNALVIIGD